MAGEKGAAPMEDEYKSFLAELGGKDPRAAGGETSRPGLGSGENWFELHRAVAWGAGGHGPLGCRGQHFHVWSRLAARLGLEHVGPAEGAMPPCSNRMRATATPVHRRQHVQAWI